MNTKTILLNDNKQYRKFTGVDLFHKEGYFGKRVSVASGEIWSLNIYNPNNQCYNPKHFLPITEYDHAINTAATFFQVAPEAKLYPVYSTNGRYGKQYDSKFFDYSADIIDEYNITLMFTSLLSMRHNEWYNDLSNWMNEHPSFKWFWSAGNDDNFYNPIIEIDQMFGVSAYTISTTNTIYPYKINYASELIDIIYSAPTMTYTNIKALKKSDIGYVNSGTSFSAPWLCGMMALVDDFFIDNTGHSLSRNAMKQFMNDNAVTISKSNIDTAIKMVYLPKPSSIDIDKYKNIK